MFAHAGVVTAIAGPASGDAFFEGPGGHAGGVLMKDRHDAVLAGAEFALAVENVALNTNSVHSVATSGVFTVEPGAENSIGRRVGVSVDVRDIDKDRRNGMVEALKQKAESIGQERDVLATFNLRTSDDPAKCDDSIVETVRRVVANQKYKHIDLVSRAYHDSLLMARKFPTGMIFSKCTSVSLISPAAGDFCRSSTPRTNIVKCCLKSTSCWLLTKQSTLSRWSISSLG